MISAPGTQILVAVLIGSAMMIVLWCVQRRTHNAGIVDAGWAAAIGLLAVSSQPLPAAISLAASL